MRSLNLEAISKKIDTSTSFTAFFVGDSITEGARATSSENTYVAVFAREMAERYKNKRIIRFDGKRHSTPDGELLPILTYGEPIEIQRGAEGTITVVRSGIGGNTVRRLLDRGGDFIDREVGGNKADLIIVNAGINDALFKDKKKYVSVSVFGENLNILINEIEKVMPDTDIVFVTPTYRDSGLSNESHLDAYADEMKKVALEREVPCIDLHRAWMEHLTVGGENYGQGNWLSGVAGDSCHPGDEGHRAIAKILTENLFQQNER